MDKPNKNVCIIALKIYDECRQQFCIEQGPVISDEHCECIILTHNCESDFGRVILPERPICLPEQISKVKVATDSFKIKSIKIIEISPSQINKDFWDIEIQFTFKFKIQMFEKNMTPLKILCCPSTVNSSKNNKNVKNYICCSLKYIKQVTLFGSNAVVPITSSDIFTQPEVAYENAPHVLVEATAFPLDIALKSPNEACHFKDVFDDIYCEPIIYIFITIGLIADIKLFRLVNLLIEAENCEVTKLCNDSDDNPCELFSQMNFTDDIFSPQK